VSDIYTQSVVDPPVDYNNCINKFLGDEILANPIVQGSKLTVQEKTTLDRPLTIEELDKSILHCNLKSAERADGVSNNLIKKCWQFLKDPAF
jgi:hypothetical protein